MNNDPLGLGGYRTFAQPTAAPASVPRQQNKKKQKDFFTDQISTGGGIGGALAGGAAGAALGSAVPIVGTTIGGLIGAILGGAAGSGAGEFTENVVTGEEDKFKNVGQEALLGGVFSAPPVRLARGVIGAAKGAATGAAKEGFEQGFTKQATQNGAQKFTRGVSEKMYAQAFTTPRREAAQLKPQKTARELLDYGVGGSLETIDGTSRAALGQLGKIVDQAAVDVGGQIKVGDVTGVVNSALKGVKVTGPDRKALMDRITEIGTKGVMPGFARPSELLDVVRDLESRGFARINAGSTGLVKNPDIVDLGNAYVQAAKEIEDKIYSAVSQTGSLKALQTPEIAGQLNSVAKGLGDKFLAAKDMGQVRSLMAPFVRAKNLVSMTVDEAQSAASGTGLLGRGAGAGVGALVGGLPGAALGFLAAPLARGAEEAARAPIATGAARLLNKTAGSGGVSNATQATGGVLPTTIRQGVGQNLLSPTTATEPTFEDVLINQSQNTSQMGGGASAMNQTGQMEVSQQTEQSPYARENLLYDIQRDPENADKYIAYYQQLQEVYKPAPATELNASQQKMAVTAQNALGDISVLANAIEDDTIGRNLVPFSDNALVGGALGVNDLNAALYNIGDVILRSRTGAAAPKEEVEKFIAGYLPRAGESKETQRYKLQRAYSELLGMTNPPKALGVGTTNSLEDAILATQR